MLCDAVYCGDHQRAIFEWVSSTCSTSSAYPLRLSCRQGADELDRTHSSTNRPASRGTQVAIALESLAMQSYKRGSSSIINSFTFSTFHRSQTHLFSGAPQTRLLAAEESGEPSAIWNVWL